MNNRGYPLTQRINKAILDNQIFPDFFTCFLLLIWQMLSQNFCYRNLVPFSISSPSFVPLTQAWYCNWRFCSALSHKENLASLLIPRGCPFRRDKREADLFGQVQRRSMKTIRGLKPPWEAESVGVVHPRQDKALERPWVAAFHCIKRA